MYDLRIWISNSSTRHPESLKVTLSCCVCGRDFTDEDLIIRLTAYRHVITEDDGLGFKLMRSKFEDQTEERFSHMSCAAQEGSMFLIGAGGDMEDV